MRESRSNNVLEQFYDSLGPLLGGRVLARYPSLDELDLSGNEKNFVSMTVADLDQVLTAIPASVTKLDLSGNYFNEMLVDNLTQLLSKIPANVTRLDLEGNDLGLISGNGLARALHNIPKNVNEIDLSDNTFYRISVDDLTDLFSSVPAHVTSLTLSRNELGRMPVDNLAQMLASIPAHVTTLDLCVNFVPFIMTSHDLAQVFDAIPHTVTTLIFLYEDIMNFLDIIGDPKRELNRLMKAVTDIDPRSRNESFQINRIHTYITTLLTLFRSLSLQPKYYDAPSIIPAKNNFYSAFLLILSHPEVLTENKHAIDDCLKNITIIDDRVILELVSRYPGKILSNPLLEKILLKSNPSDQNINRLFSRLLNKNMNTNKVYSLTDILLRLQERKGNSASMLIFSSLLMKKLHRDYLIENRHQSPVLQKEYDSCFAIIKR